MARLSLALASLLALAAPAVAVDGLAPKPGEPRQQANPAVGIDEKIGAQAPMDLLFADESGRDVTLGECIGGKPTILVMAYYRCPMNCTDVLNGLLDAVNPMQPDVSMGKAFNVVTVTFDPKETYEAAREKKKTYLKLYRRGAPEEGWRFLSGKVGYSPRQREDAVEQLAGAVGFKFQYDKVFKEYDHPTGVIVLTPTGKVSRYFYGQKYQGEFQVPGGTTTLELSLVGASQEKVGALSLVERLILQCYRFDHLEKKFSMNYMLAVRAAGAVTVLALVGGVAFHLIRERRRPAAKAAAEPSDANPNGAGADRPAEDVK